MSLKAFLETGIAYSKLQAGEHKAVILSVSHQEVPANQKNPDGNEYIKVEMSLIHKNNRPLTENKFEQSFRIMLAQIKDQLDLTLTDVSVPELLNTLITQKVIISIYVEYVTRNNKEYRNINFAPTIVQDLATTAQEVEDVI